MGSRGGEDAVVEDALLEEEDDEELEELDAAGVGVDVLRIFNG